MLKVLIVDDSFFLRASLRLQLKAIGCEVVGEAADGAQALERYRVLRPDLVTVDVVLDPESGIHVAQQIIQVDPKAKILMVSAVGQQKIMEETRQAGACGYVHKPVEMSALKEAIEKITGEVL
jgi:two-component system, chemotaxis family, chemotaxis protein CheY